MTATERLRALLDERGVEHKDNEDVTRFFKPDGFEVVMQEDIDGKLDCLTPLYLTPEQAVEATLGRVTCRQIETEEGFIVCSECGAPQPEDYTVYYCWCCGRKVVDA